MAKSTENSNSTIFFLELMLAMLIPFVIWWSNTPTNILNSGFLWNWLECIGLGGIALIFFAGIPVGIIGIRKAKRMEKLRIATVVLSILNLVAGIIESVILILVFCAVVFGGSSV